MLISYSHCDATPKHGGLQPQVCVLPTGLLVLCSLLNLGQASAYVLFQAKGWLELARCRELGSGLSHLCSFCSTDFSEHALLEVDH